MFVLANLVTLVAAQQFIRNILFNITASNGDRLLYRHNIDALSESRAIFSSPSLNNGYHRFELLIENDGVDIESLIISKYDGYRLLESHDIDDLIDSPGKDTKAILKTMQRVAPGLHTVMKRLAKDGKLKQKNPRNSKALPMKLRRLLPPKLAMLYTEILERAIKPFLIDLEQSIPDDIHSFVEADWQNAYYTQTYFNVELKEHTVLGVGSISQTVFDEQGLKVGVISSQYGMAELMGSRSRKPFDTDDSDSF